LRRRHRAPQAAAEQRTEIAPPHVSLVKTNRGVQYTILPLPRVRNNARILRVGVIKLYEGLVRYELRCSQLYARTIVVFAE
jgi:hypothetical protein